MCHYSADEGEDEDEEDDEDIADSPAYVPIDDGSTMDFGMRLLQAIVAARRFPVDSGVSPIETLILSRGPRVWKTFGLTDEMRQWFTSNLTKFVAE